VPTLKTISPLILPLLLALGLTGCTATLSPAGGQTVEGSGTLAEETRPIGDVTAVELAMPGTLHIELGAASLLRVSAEDNLLEWIETEAPQGGGELVIQTTPGVDLLPRDPIDYYLTVPGLDTLIVSSSGDVEAPDIVASHFSVTINSSGNVALRSLQAETLDADLSSSGNLIIGGGQVGRQEISLSSSGNYMAKDVASLEAQADLSSSGSATLRVQDSLRATLSSNGMLYYLGSPQVTLDVSSSGQAVQIEE
jgi:hypothetical protein